MTGHPSPTKDKLPASCPSRSSPKFRRPIAVFILSDSQSSCNGPERARPKEGTHVGTIVRSNTGAPQKAIMQLPSTFTPRLRLLLIGLANISNGLFTYPTRNTTTGLIFNWVRCLHFAENRGCSRNMSSPLRRYHPPPSKEAALTSLD